MQLGSGSSWAPYLVSDESDENSGRTIIWRQDVISDVVPPLKPPNPGVNCGLTSIAVDFDGGVASITWTFQAKWGDESEPPPPDDRTTLYELDGATSVEPIATHPNILNIVKKYARGLKDDGEVDWLLKNPDNAVASNSSLPGPEATEMATDVNPLYGVRDYLKASATFKQTRYYGSRGAVPAAVVGEVGRISNPTGLSGADPGKWLCAGAQMRQMGDSYQVGRVWLAATTGVWNPVIYG
jgi:hypothetical protein